MSEINVHSHDKGQIASTIRTPINCILNRTEIANNIKEILQNPAANKSIYIYGKAGIGKTQFVIQLLKECNFEHILYDAGTMRNKNVIDDIAKHSANHVNVMSIFQRKQRQIAFIMDEIDGMNNGDKGGINTLIKIMRHKKPVHLKGGTGNGTTTKKGRRTTGTTTSNVNIDMNDVVHNPIICIANYKSDKKIKELMKACTVFELNTPSDSQIQQLVPYFMGSVADASPLPLHLIQYIQNDLRKLAAVCRLLTKTPELLNDPEKFNQYFQYKSYNDDTKNITGTLLTNPYCIADHNRIINETDRTSVGLLWHENIIDHLDHITDPLKRTQFYVQQLNNICFADYIDRITFQKQVWQFNEMSSLIKTMKNNTALAETWNNIPIPHRSISSENVRFTKVLTKYSTEYNNFLFIQKLCQQLNMDKKDMLGYFLQPNLNSDIATLSSIDIKKLDIARIQRYLTNIVSAPADDADEITIDDFDATDVDAEGDIDTTDVDLY